jgi:flagellar protein FlgJ
VASDGDVARAGVYTDFSGLAALRRDATNDPTRALDEVARQFEALFLQQILEQTRSEALGDDLLGGDSVGQYTQMFHQQLALEMASGEGMGLREVLLRQLSAMPAVDQQLGAVSAAAADPQPGAASASLSPERVRFEARVGGDHER